MGPHTKPPAEDLVLDAMNDLRRVVRALRLTSRSAEKRLGVSGAQLFVLQQLRAKAASSMEELAARTVTDQSSVSEVVGRLEKRGLVARHRSPVDGRRVEIALTPRGRVLSRRAPAPAQAQIADGLRRMSAPHLRQLAVSLHRLVAELGMAGEQPALFFESEDV
jgi:DNA-binding MarR family transcriptional regulator